jgi:hypothetical protein
MTKTTMISDLLQTLKILTKFGIELRRHELRVLSILDILLSVKEPVWNFIGAWVGYNVHNCLKLFSTQFSCALSQVYFRLLAADGGETATHTSNGSQSVQDLLLSVNVGIQHTENMCETVWCHKGLQNKQAQQISPAPSLRGTFNGLLFTATLPS